MHKAYVFLSESPANAVKFLYSHMHSDLPQDIELLIILTWMKLQ